MAKCQSGKNIALLVGCNYPKGRCGNVKPLKGCHNDVDAVHATLIEVFGFNHNNIEVLTDKLGTKAGALPTGAIIKSVLEHLIKQLGEGDTLFFHFSGHGTRFPYPSCDCNKIPSKCTCEKREAIVACDSNFITNVDFRELVDGMPRGATFLFFSDSCHSGGLIDKEKEQIGPNTSFRGGTIQSDNGRFIPYEIVLDSLCETLSIPRGRNNMARNVQTIMQRAFGSEASLLFRPARRESPPPLKPAQGILLSACQSDESALEYEINKELCYGVFTYAFLVIIKEKLLSHPFSSKKLVMKAREIIPGRSLIASTEKQHPCLYCSDDNVNRTYLFKPKDSKPASLSGKNMALLVGCNNPNSKLPNFTPIKRSSHNNNVSVMHKILTTEFGFDDNNIEILTDKPGTEPGEMPTGANIKSALTRSISRLQVGGVLFLYFTGPGTAIASAKSGSNFVKAIVPCDGNVITSMDFRELVDRVPDGATFTFLADCNYSGGLIDKEKEQIGPNTRSGSNMPRALKEDQGILLSACQWNEFAMDCEQCMGAFTHAVQVIIQEKLLKRPFTNKELVMKAREIMVTRILPNERQHPCLYCSDKNANHFFLSNLSKK